MSSWFAMTKRLLDESRKREKRKQQCPKCKKFVKPQLYTKDDRDHWRCPDCGHHEPVT